MSSIPPAQGILFPRHYTTANILPAVTLNGNLDLATATGSERSLRWPDPERRDQHQQQQYPVLRWRSDSGRATGIITLGNTGGGNRVSIEGTLTLTLGSNILIHGENGTIGQEDYIGGAATLINNGTISADVAGGTINLVPNNGTTNNGTLEAKNGGTLAVELERRRQYRQPDCGRIGQHRDSKRCYPERCHQHFRHGKFCC